MLRNIFLYLLIGPVTFLCYLEMRLRDIFNVPIPIDRITRFWFHSILGILNIRIKAVGMENIHAGCRYVIMSNHTSALDIPALMQAIPMRISFMAKKEIFRIPCLGGSMRYAGHISIDRGRPRRALEQIRAFTKNLKFKEHSIIFFPEGTRSLDGAIWPFKRGGFQFAMEEKFPILPVTICGASRLLQKRQWFVRSGEIQIVIHAPMEQGRYEQREFMDKVRNTILAGLVP